MTAQASRPADAPPYPHVRHLAPSPWEAEHIRQLTRCQIADRMVELGALRAATSGAGPLEWNRLSRTFLHRLVIDLRRPGFALLIAENDTTTACAYGYPRSPGLFEIREMVVPRRVREQFTNRDWNLARRLQRRLLDDHGHATGLISIDRSDLRGLRALEAWGWQEPAGPPHGLPSWNPHRVLLLTP
ncbi:hypothetical protein ACOKM3_22945 [Streptomyces sp. BH106]|uniref:hypothetical protein n=1 Tax=Streptomyces sp. BH106 TaxID=3410409 RepID=UPI003CF91533